MLNKEDFFRLITQPDELTAMHLLEIEGASLNFPYCQLIHFILAKAYYEQSNPEALLTVKKAAIYATQREGLKIFLHKNSTNSYEFLSSATQNSVEPIEEFIAPSSIKPPEIEVISEKKTSTIDLKKFESTLLPPHHFEIVNPSPNTNSVADDVLSGLKKLKDFTDHIDKPSTSKKIVLPNENIEKVVEKFSFEDVLKVVENKNEIKKEQENEKVFPTFNTGINTTIADDVLADLQKLKKFTIDNEPIVEASLSEIHIKPEEKIINIINPIQEEPPIIINEPQSSADDIIINSIEEPKNIESNTFEDNDKPFELGRLNENDKDIIAFTLRMRNEKKEKEKEIIEKFINNEPRLKIHSSNQQENTSSIKDLSDNYNNSNVLLASENLANIMVKQGKINSAIEILHKLILKNPEKSTYFANRINELKNLSTDNQL